MCSRKIQDSCNQAWSNKNLFPPFLLVPLTRQPVTVRLLTASSWWQTFGKCVWRGQRRNGNKGKTGRQKWRQWGAICWPKGERTRRFERNTFRTRHQMQYKKPAFQTPRNRLCTPKPSSPAHHSSQCLHIPWWWPPTSLTTTENTSQHYARNFRCSTPTKTMSQLCPRKFRQNQEMSLSKSSI